ncbi:hypothetical protein [Rhodanobacter sp. TND4EL1]
MHAGRGGRLGNTPAFDDVPGFAASGNGAGLGHGVNVGRQTQQLIEAMSRFAPAVGESSPLDHGMAWQDALIASNADVTHRFKPLPQSSGL